MKKLKYQVFVTMFVFALVCALVGFGAGWLVFS